MRRRRRLARRDIITITSDMVSYSSPHHHHHHYQPLFFLLNKNPPPEQIVRETQVEFFKRVKKGFPETPLVYAIGNNDLWPNNKNNEHNFKELYDIMVKECPTCAIFLHNPEENKKTFLAGGYYVYRYD